MVAVFLFLVTVTLLAHDGAAQTISGILPCGVLYNRDEPSLIQNGFIKCYDQPYSHVTTSTELTACSGTNVVFVGAKSNSSTTTIALGAFGLSSNVYKVTSSTTAANSDPGGAYWYKYPLYGFGFSGVPTVHILDCDYAQPAGDCAYRLCWNLDFSIGGYRVGCLENLNTNPTWRKVMYKGNQVYSCTSVCSNGALRLQNGTTTANGRVEVCYNNTWGTVCDNLWGNQDAQVVCRQFGYTAGTALSNAYYGKGNVSVLLDNVNCLGTESSLLNCPNSGIGVTSCTHADDASVQCSGCGVLYNYDEPTLYLNGFTKCYDQPYSHVTTSTELAACTGTNWVFVGAKNSSNSTTIVLGAQGYSSTVYTRTSSTTIAYLDKYGGAYWYNYPTYGFGFSGVSSVNIYNCDAGQAAGYCAYRLCWNIDFGLAGYRVGCLENLNSDANRRKVMYKGDQFLYSCTPDVNECLKSNGNCSQVCTNLLGSYTCSCMSGYLLNADGITCTDINECSNNMGNCSQTCTNTNGSYICSCGNGYLLTSDNRTCLEINECLTNNGGCAQNCNNTIGSFICSCNSGFTLKADNRTCEDRTPCAINNGNCSQICIGTLGSSTCACITGYQLNTDNLTCTDINECALNNGNCSQLCTNMIGSYYCSCASGYLLNSNNRTCSDINECAKNNGNCSQTCTNTNGSYICSCSSGYTLNSNNRTCSDINECLTFNGGCAQNCTNTNGSFMCGCRNGYNLNTDNRTCSPVCGILYNYNELSLNLSGYTKCYDQPYSHITTSAELVACRGSTWVFVGGKNNSNSSTIVLGAFGYSSLVYTPTTSTSTAYWDKYGGVYWYDYTNWGFGFTAVPTISLVYCDGIQTATDCAHRLCWNLDEGIGGARIGCSISLNSDSTRRKVMYKGNQVYTCTPDIDECATNNGNCSQFCINTLGSYYCSCTTGYMLSANNQSCADVNECATTNGNCSQICTNTNGSYTCSCQSGYSLNANNRTCSDINECLTNNGGCVQNCANTNGSFICSCNLGFALNADNRTCSDNTPCAINNGNCAQICIGTVGSSKCACTAGYVLNGDNMTCSDINECVNNNGNCSQVCTNTNGSYFCSCLSGYMLNANGLTCADINECSKNNGNCSQTCNNINGSYSCSCTTGYLLNTDNLTCSDINECLLNNGGCAQNCNNTGGGYSCSCRTGYYLNPDNKTCGLICGVIYSYDELTLNLSGYTKCYDQPYSDVTTTSDLAACKGSTWVFVGAKPSSSATNIVLGAFGYSSAVYTTTSSTTTAYLDRYGGAYWYNYPLYGFGFSGVSSVHIYDCDYAQPAGDCAYRLCWNLDFGIGGYRVGCLESLNTDPTWRKVMYKGNQVYSCAPDVNECATLNGGCTQICTNTLGSYSCSCTAGYTLGSDNQTCIDVNECAASNGNCSQKCTNTIGSYTCSCVNGQGLTNDSKTCTDINECLINNGGCQQNCANTDGSFVCSCNLGYALNSDNMSCADFTPCAINNGNCSQNCIGTLGSSTCSCRAGFYLSNDKMTCTDINECANNNGNCSQICTNTNGSYVCSCLSGYMLNANGQTCADVNECTKNNGNCSQTCTNANGSYSCSCMRGYLLNLDNQTCSDINECLVNNGGCARYCNNTNGGYSCTCGTGYFLNTDNKTCTPICGVIYSYDELTLNLSGYTKCYDQPYSDVTTTSDLAACKGSTWVFVGAKPSSSATNIVLGAFGYSSAVYTTTSSTTTAYLDRYGGAYWYNYPLYGFGFSGVPTVHILDCDYAQPAGDCAYRLCWNVDYSIGGYRVGCLENLNTDPTWRKVMYKGNQVNTCAPDINECATLNGNCSQICTNTPGSATCSCMTGYVLNPDLKTCADINECAGNKGNCSQLCNNIDGSYYCNCWTGYRLNPDNKTCSDINECTVNSGGCSQMCSNTNGSFICSCGAGYSLNADNLTCVDARTLSPSMAAIVPSTTVNTEIPSDTSLAPSMVATTVNKPQSSGATSQAVSIAAITWNALMSTATPSGTQSLAPSVAGITSTPIVNTAKPTDTSLAPSMVATTVNAVKSSETTSQAVPIAAITSNALMSVATPSAAQAPSMTPIVNTVKPPGATSLAPSIAAITSNAVTSVATASETASLIPSMAAILMTTANPSVDIRLTITVNTPQHSESTSLVQPVATPTSTITVNTVISSDNPSLAPSMAATTSTATATMTGTFIQVRLATVSSCAAWKDDNSKITAIVHQVEYSVNSFCFCGFTIQSAGLYCFDNFSITLRGSSESKLVAKLQEWVVNKGATVQTQGNLLTVDKNCMVQIGSLDVPGCTGSVTNAQQSSPSHTTVAIGATLGTSFFLVISAIICILLIAAVRRRNGKKNAVRNPVYEAANPLSGLAPDNDLYYTIPNPPLVKYPITWSDFDTMGDKHIQYRNEEPISLSDFEMNGAEDTQGTQGTGDLVKEDIM